MNKAFKFLQFVFGREPGGKNNIGDVIFDLFIQVNLPDHFPGSDDIGRFDDALIGGLESRWRCSAE